MADNLTDTAEARFLNWLTGNATVAPVLPLKLRLMTANGSDTTPGTEVTNAGGSAYAPQTITFPVAVAGSPVANDTDITFANMPAATIVGAEIWDSAGSPVRWWYGTATANKQTNLGDPLKVLTGALVLTGL